jgi:hypothetical protein
VIAEGDNALEKQTKIKEINEQQLSTNEGNLISAFVKGKVSLSLSKPRRDEWREV